MIEGAILRAKKLKAANHIRAAVAHNKRQIQAELGAGGHIDPARCCLNESIGGPATPEDALMHAEAMMTAAGIGKLRKDAVRALEFIVSLCAGHRLEERAFFTAAAEWLAARFGGVENILGADIHRDEAAPHMHLLVLPLIDGRMVGSDALGGKAKLQHLQADFFRAVCEPYGLKRYPTRLAGSSKAALVAAVLAELQRLRDPAVKGILWPLLRAHIEADPTPAASALGVSAPASTKPRKPKTMTDIFISKGKGSQKPYATPNPIGFDTPRVDRTLSCVGFEKKATGSRAESLGRETEATAPNRLVRIIRSRLPFSAAPTLIARNISRPAAYHDARANLNFCN